MQILDAMRELDGGLDMEHAIGTRVTLEVVERTESGCNGCFFGQGNDCSMFDNWECDGLLRKDKKNVIFKEVKEE